VSCYAASAPGAHQGVQALWPGACRLGRLVAWAGAGGSLGARCDALSGCLDRRREGGDVVGALVPAFVDEERRRARDSAQVGGVDVFGDAGGSGVAV
jgi:hypothetical protein